MSSPSDSAGPSAWLAVFAMSFNIFVIIGAAFLLIGRLLPVSHGLDVAERLAGLTTLMNLPNILTAMTPTLLVALAGRAAISGAAAGPCWERERVEADRIVDVRR